MNTPRLDSPDRQERLQAAHDLGFTPIATPAVFHGLLGAIRDAEFSVAYEAVKSLALLGDRSVLPLLIEERQAVIAKEHPSDEFFDASAGSIEPALTMAIISLLTPTECEKILETGNQFEKDMVRRKHSVASTEEFWGEPCRSRHG